MMGLENQVCSTWPEITECLGNLSTRTTYDPEFRDIDTTEWVFRGVNNSCHGLKPAIERIGSAIDWYALEYQVSSEFKARARVHMAASMVPEDKAEFTWLALMQHYGIPTRLLDFTYSPFVALYFAIRNGQSHEELSLRETGPGRHHKHVRVWAVDARAVKARFHRVASDALGKESKFKKAASPTDFRSYADYLDSLKEQELHPLIDELLSATGDRRKELSQVLKQKGCVCVDSPPAFNPRLGSQQGAFLFNFAEYLSFWKSLTKMMAGYS